MCGICGVVHSNYADKVDEDLVRRMTAVLSHRGPDDEGLLLKDHVGLGHRRLSIIDLSASGHQPMSNEDQTIWIVFNGEIYNYVELRPGLEAKGHRFSSHTDTEVILHLYEEEGPECVTKLRGMFAFAIWDGNKQRLFLARDRVGKKPLLYTLHNGRFLFASEIKSLLEDGTIRREVDLTALHHYLTYQYVPSPLTMFSGIYKVPPAHTLIYEKGQLHTQRYWNLSHREKLYLPSLRDYGEQFLSLFREAVKIRLRSDVPLGAFLSGGIDSSLTVAIMSTMMNQKVKTFSIGFREQEYNELRYARLIAERFGTDHHEFIVKPDAVEILPTLIWHYNEPFADSSAIPTYYVSRLTREHVTVALNGDGGDESFAGYDRYIADRLAGYLFKIPRVLREEVIQKVAKLLPYNPRRQSFFRRLKRFLKAISDPAERRYVRWICYFDNEMKEDLFTSDFNTLMEDIDSVDLTVQWFERSDGENPVDRTLFVDVMSYLPDDLLVKVDIASMANALEARSPFLDHPLMEFCASLPETLKLKGLEGKYLLKQCLPELLPAQILSRRKMGFGVPLELWFRKELKAMSYETLLARRSLERGYFREGALRNLLEEHTRGEADHSYRIWALLMLELWHRMFIDAS